MSLFARYRALDYTLPKTCLRWELDGAGFDRLKLVEAPAPRPKDDEIAFRVDVNCLCFSDIKIIRQGQEHVRLKKYDLARDKVVPGHEIALTVTAVGRDVKDRFAAGQRFIVQADLIKYHSAVGYDVWGGLRQYGVFGPKVHEDYLIPVQPDTGYSKAALSEPWACVEASYHRADLNAEDDVVWLVGGAGPMGQMHLERALAKRRSGASPNLRAIIVTDVSDERLKDLLRRHADSARDAGVELAVVNPANENQEQAVRRIAPDGVAYAVGLCPVAEVIVDALKLVRMYGVLNVFAGLKRGTGAVTLGDVHYDQVTITGNSGSTLADMKACLAGAESGTLDTDAAVGAVAGMRAARKGLEAVAEGRVSNKIAIYVGLADLPLMLIEDLPDRLAFPDDIARQLRRGRWSAAAEKALLDQLLKL